MVVNATKQMIVQQVEGIDDATCKQIHDMAVANGIDDVYVLDKKQILSALEKQIPKKPIEDRYPGCVCPACGGSVYLKNIQERIMISKTTYCEHCGQALDWGDSE
jgi:hypothetical protein